MSSVFDAPDVEAMTLDDLRAIPSEHWPHLRFRSIPALALMHAEWPVHELWSGGVAEKIRQAPTWIRIWRNPEYQVFHAPIGDREAEALKRMIGGEPFAAICDAYADLPGDEAARESITTLLSWLERGLIAGAQ